AGRAGLGRRSRLTSGRRLRRDGSDLARAGRSPLSAGRSNARGRARLASRGRFGRKAALARRADGLIYPPNYDHKVSFGSPGKADGDYQKGATAPPFVTSPAWAWTTMVLPLVAPDGT